MPEEQQFGGLSVPSETKPSITPKGVSETLDDVQSKLSEDFSAATDTVKEAASSAMQKVQDTVGDQKNFATRQVGAVASALQKVGAELESTDQPQVGRYAKQLGESAQAFAKEMEGKALSDIAVMAENFGRKQPLAFLGVAAIAGLTASRFLTASAHRKATEQKKSVTSVSKEGQGGDNGKSI
jgi:ElaB/YqjD/DUF883 family membrane-anchored ribosome-binding protein